LIASARAAQLGGDVILLEKMKLPGKKLLISGKGRCNITNVASVKDFISHFGKNGKFLYQVFYKFFSDEIVAILESKNVETIVERGGRIFPKSGISKDVVDALVNYALSNGVQIKYQSNVKRIIVENNKVIGVEFTGKSGKEFLHTKSLILATGGVSYPKTGSSGDGYRMAEKLNHKIIPLKPALIPLETSDATINTINNLNLKNVKVTIISDDNYITDSFGEMSFIDNRITGPIILTLSKIIVEMLDENQKVELSIDLKPALSNTKLDKRLIREINENGKLNFRTILKQILPQKLISVCVEQTKVSENKLGHQITSEERKLLLAWLKKFRFTISRYRPISEAIVTSGGINLQEVNPRTMESKLINGLYFCGEVLDIDADTGGYNLQAAFSTGWVAGQSSVTK